MTALGPMRIEIHKPSRCYIIKQIAIEPQVYVVYFRDLGETDEQWVHRDGRSLDDALVAVREHWSAVV